MLRFCIAKAPPWVGRLARHVLPAPRRQPEAGGLREGCLGRGAPVICPARRRSHAGARSTSITLWALIPLLCTPALHADDTFDWVMGHATTAAAAQPATQSATRPSPLTRPGQAQDPSGTITLSDGTTLSGPISTTPGKPLRIWVEQEHQYLDIPLAEVQRIEAAVLWERMEREWHFIASGSDVKEYTGRTYPARELQFTFTLRDGRKITGGTVAPLYVQQEADPRGSRGSRDPRLVVLPKRQKGEIGTDLVRLLYPKKVEISAGGQNTP